MVEDWLNQINVCALITPMLGQDISKVVPGLNVQHVDVTARDYASDKVER